jgi:hypothetical protein
MPQTPERKLEYDREYRKRNHWRRTGDIRWAENLKHRHGMDPAQWQAMYDEQNGECYLCRHPLPEDRGKIAIDHDHGHCSGRRSCRTCVRGLACDSCNKGISQFGDDPERMRRAADNLERAQAIIQALRIGKPEQPSLLDTDGAALR